MIPVDAANLLKKRVALKLETSTLEDFVMNGSAFISRSEQRRWTFGWLIGWLSLSAVWWLGLGGSSDSSSLPQVSATASFDNHTSGSYRNKPIGGVQDLVCNRKPIEEIRVGQRVWTEDYATTSQPTAVDPKTWRLIKLRSDVRWKDGTLDDVNVETLQPPEWLAKHNATLGGLVPIPLDLVEMGFPHDLRGIVVGIEVCPPISCGTGCVVLTTVNHLNPDVRELTVADDFGRQQVLKPTGFHKFLREPDAKWVSTCDLAVGDHLRGKNGRLCVIGNRAFPGVHRVYNMTIETEHVYYVSALGVLTHNPGCGQPYYGPGSIFQVGPNWQGLNPPPTQFVSPFVHIPKVTVNNAMGNIFQQQVLAAYPGAVANTTPMFGTTLAGKPKTVVPDATIPGGLLEIKAWQYLPNTSQLQAMQSLGQPLTIVVPPGSILSQPLLNSLSQHGGRCVWFPPNPTGNFDF